MVDEQATSLPHVFHNTPGCFSAQPLLESDDTTHEVFLQPLLNHLQGPTSCSDAGSFKSVISRTTSCIGTCKTRTGFKTWSCLKKRKKEKRNIPEVATTASRNCRQLQRRHSVTAHGPIGARVRKKFRQGGQGGDPNYQWNLGCSGLDARLGAA